MLSSGVKNFTAVIERCTETGLFVGFVPGFPGAHSQAESLDELTENLRRMQCPTLLLVGEHFYYIQHRDEFHNKNKYLRSEVLAGARFCMGWERAADVGRYTLEFLRAPA